MWQSFNGQILLERGISKWPFYWNGVSVNGHFTGMGVSVNGHFTGMGYQSMAILLEWVSVNGYITSKTNKK